MYLELVPYEESILENMVQPNETVEMGDSYDDVLDTRAFLAKYIEPIANRLMEFPYVQTAYVRKASRKTKKGLSIYIDIIFKHPRNLSQEQINEGYKYSLRFSDHEGSDSKLIAYIPMVGTKPKNFMGRAVRYFVDNTDKVQISIKNFELKTFGEQKTFLFKIS